MGIVMLLTILADANISTVTSSVTRLSA